MVSSTEKVSATHGKVRKCYPLSSCLHALLHRPGNWTMSNQEISVIVSFWYHELANATQLKVVQVNTSEEVHLSDGSFLLRISRDEHTLVERCLIRHLGTGREAYVQGGPNLRAFVKSCLLNDGGPEPPATNTQEG